MRLWNIHIHQKIYCNLAPELSIFDVITNPSLNCFKISFTLFLSSLVTNEKTGVKSFIDLVPHINLIDNFHYARNMSLPGNVDDNYTVEFFINNPSQYDLSFHKDWKDNFSESLISDQDFKYENVSFTEIASLKRR